VTKEERNLFDALHLVTRILGARIEAMEQLLVEKGHLSTEEIHKRIGAIERTWRRNEKKATRYRKIADALNRPPGGGTNLKM
jgi:hypothetical protein